MGAETVIEAWLSRFKRRREGGALVAQEAQPDRAAALGALGEALVAGVLRDMGWPMLRNVVLRERGRSTEIDVIARAPASFVVLEVKNWSGFIYGAPDVISWGRRGRGSDSIKLLNPVIQNRAHVNAIVRAIDDRTVPVWGLVVSVGNARFSPELLRHVVPIGKLEGILRGTAGGGPSNGKAMERAWAMLSREAKHSSERKAGHISWLKARWARDRHPEGQDL
jgi:hypothetical protein